MLILTATSITKLLHHYNHMEIDIVYIYVKVVARTVSHCC